MTAQPVDPPLRNANRTLIRAMKLHGPKCFICGRPKLVHTHTDGNVVVEADTTVDHHIPLSRGGTNAARNLVPACEPCNQSKGDKMPNGWKWFVRTYPESYRGLIPGEVRKRRRSLPKYALAEVAGLRWSEEHERWVKAE